MPVKGTLCSCIESPELNSSGSIVFSWTEVFFNSVTVSTRYALASTVPVGTAVSFWDSFLSRSVKPSVSIADASSTIGVASTPAGRFVFFLNLKHQDTFAQGLQLLHFDARWWEVFWWESIYLQWIHFIVIFKLSTVGEQGMQFLQVGANDGGNWVRTLWVGAH